jgi:hypothetical protein
MRGEMIRALLLLLRARARAPAAARTYRRGDSPQEDVQRPREALHAEEVVAVGRDGDVVEDTVDGRGRRRRPAVRDGAGPARLLGGALGEDLVELDAELEAELVELLVRVDVAQARKEVVALHGDGRHLLLLSVDG